MAKERTKLAVIGDPHLGVPRSDDDQRLEVDPGRKLHGLSTELLTATIDEINATGSVDATIIMGDLTRDSEQFNHEVARSSFARLNMPFYLVLGNHDLVRTRNAGVTYPDEPRFDRDEFIQFYQGAGLPGDTTRYAVELPGGVVLVVLDCNRTQSELKLYKDGVKRQDHGFIDLAQRRWLDSVLRNVRSMGRTPLVAMHHSVTDHSPAEVKGHPLQPFFGYWKLHGARKLLRVLARNNVPLVLSGHLHAQSVNIEDGVTNLVTAASVGYPHAWRLLTVTDSAIHVESFPLKSIPSCPDLQEQSRIWLSAGMGQLVEEHSGSMPVLQKMTGGLSDFIVKTGWWPSFCDGTMDGFFVDEELLPNGNPVSTMVYKKIAGLMNEYGVWKSLRPNPNNLTIPLNQD